MEHAAPTTSRTRRVPSRAAAPLVLLVALAWVAVTFVALPQPHAAADGVDTVDEISANYGDDAGSSMWLHWRGAETDVAYGTDTGYGQQATGQPPQVAPVDVTGPFYRVLLTGLTPGTVYHYRIGAGGADHQFETAPTSDFSWDDIGDTGSSYYLPGSPAGCNRPFMPSYWQLLAADNADLYTHGGDVSYANQCGNAASHQVFDDVQTVTTLRPMEWTQGNHEYGAPQPGAPAGTVRDVLNNYKGRWVMAHGQSVPNDTALQTSHPGCAATGVTGNACPGNDWGWFDVGHVRFISRPEPEPKAYPDWQAKADAIMADAQADPNIYLVVTYGHRTACSSLRVNGAYASDPNVAPAVAALGDRYSPVARPDGKYVLDIGHHVHAAEICGPVHGVWELTDGGGGAEEASIVATNPLSVWNSIHLAYLHSTMVGNTLTLNYVCGPLFTVNPTKAPPCTMGSVMRTLTITAPTGATPPPPPPPPTEYVLNQSFEAGTTGWAGVYSVASRNRLVAGGFDGAYSLRSVNGTAATANVGVIDKPHWLTAATVAGSTYTCSVWVAPDVAGTKITLALKELSPSGAVVKTTAKVLTTNATGWASLSLPAVATATGDSYGIYLSAAGVAPGQGFGADLFSLTAP